MNHPDIIMEDETPRRGRPPKEKERSFDELSEDEKILHTYVQGNFDSSVCKAIQISKEEFDQRLKDDGHFQRVVSFGRTLCQAWWEEKYVGAAAGAKVPAATMVNFAMKNMFGWAEKTETTNTDFFNIEGLTRDEALTKLREYGPNIIDLLEARERKA